MEQIVEVGDVWIAKDQPELEIEVFVISGDTVVCKLVKDWGGYVKGELVTYTKNTLFRIYAKEVDKACFDAYQEGYRFGHSDAKKEYEEKYKSEFVEVRQHHYDMGYNDALAHMASEESENRLELKKQGYEEGYDGGFTDGYSKGYNTAIEEVSNSQALGETTEYIFGTEDCCEHHSPNKETQEAMQEVLDNPFIIKPSDLFKRKYFKEDDKHKYPHYFKDVSDLKWLDVYQVCKLFPVEDDSGAISHARKKLLVCGGRGGGKDKIKDIKEARDTLNRYLEIEGEQDD